MGIDTGLATKALSRIDRPVAKHHNTSPTRTPQPQLERETGIEPVPLAWKAKVLPLNYSRIFSLQRRPSIGPNTILRL